MSESWALNEQGRLYIPNLTPSPLAYDTANKNSSAFYLDSEGRITTDIYPEPIGWEFPLPYGTWYVDAEENRLNESGLPERLYWTKPFPYSVWYIEPDFGHLFNSGIPYPIITGAFQNCTNLTYVKLPSTLTYIGPHAFENTGLTLVQIPAGCEYSTTSFPPGCEIQEYSIS